jgi:hypothetical protein
MSMTKSTRQPPGPSTDSEGRTAIDPTKNVLDLVDRIIQRQDDLRESDHTHIRETVRMQALFDQKLREVEASYEDKLRLAESKRIDAIRAVDVGAVATANAAAEARAGTLAAQVQSAATAQVVSLKAETDPIRKDIGDLRQSQWTLAGGREQVVETREKSSNWGLWAGIAVAVFVGFNGLLLTAVGVVVTIMLTR